MPRNWEAACKKNILLRILWPSARLLVFIAATLVFANLQAQPDSLATDSVATVQHHDVVITASRLSEKQFLSPVSIELLDQEALSRSAQFTVFDALQNIKGLQVITPSLGFRVVNARGFANTTNVRFVQMVDGADNQAPHIGAPVANALGPTDLDILRLEILPGSASALYGMNAINGTANFITKSPFEFQGLSLLQKGAANHLISNRGLPLPYSETNLRYAKAWHERFAFKLNAAYATGTDWYADNETDLNPDANLSAGLTGADNPGQDPINIYGNEAPNRRTLDLDGKQFVVSRTGYAEKEVADYGLRNLKGDLGFHYRPGSHSEFSVFSRVALLNTLYQRTNRFRFDDYLLTQNGLGFKTRDIAIRTYLNSESTGRSYNIRSMAENIDRGYKADNIWFAQFGEEFTRQRATGISAPRAMRLARRFADDGRPEPGSPEFTKLIDNLRRINDWDHGAALQVSAHLFHAEAQHDLTRLLLQKFQPHLGLSLLYGFDYRAYIVVPDGNYFINPSPDTKNLIYWKTGGFLQASKMALGGKLKLSMVGRVDKNQYFSPKFNPRLAAVYNPATNHSFRIAAQNGYRFPSIFEAFSNINSGGVKRVGGLPVMSRGIFENSYLRSSIDDFQAAVIHDVNTNGNSQAEAVTKNQGLLKKNPYSYLKPERVSSLEAGYRSRLLAGKLCLDADGFYNVYQNLMAQVEASLPNTENEDSIPFALLSKAGQNRYRLWTNSNTVSHNIGGTFGLTGLLPGGFYANGNITYSTLSHKTKEDGLEDGFNTPKWAFNIGGGGDKIIEGFSFGMNYRRQSAFLWQSALATGTVPGYGTLDCQLSRPFWSDKLLLRVGATNILNNHYYSFLGGPAIGGFYYLGMRWEWK